MCHEKNYLGECKSNDECGHQKQCIENKCTLVIEKIYESCNKVENTEILTGPNGIPECQCKEGFVGDPSISCEGNTRIIQFTFHHAVALLQFFLYFFKFFPSIFRNKLCKLLFRACGTIF